MLIASAIILVPKLGNCVRRRAMKFLLLTIPFSINLFLDIHNMMARKGKQPLEIFKVYIFKARYQLFPIQISPSF